MSNTVIFSSLGETDPNYELIDEFLKIKNDQAILQKRLDKIREIFVEKYGQDLIEQVTININGSIAIVRQLRSGGYDTDQMLLDGMNISKYKKKDVFANNFNVISKAGL